MCVTWLAVAMTITRTVAATAAAVALGVGGAILTAPSAEATVLGPYSYEECRERRAAYLRNPYILDANCYLEPPRAGYFLYLTWR